MKFGISDEGIKRISWNINPTPEEQAQWDREEEEYEKEKANKEKYEKKLKALARSNAESAVDQLDSADSSYSAWHFVEEYADNALDTLNSAEFSDLGPFSLSDAKDIVYSEFVRIVKELLGYYPDWDEED